MTKTLIEFSDEKIKQCSEDILRLIDDEEINSRRDLANRINKIYPTNIDGERIEINMLAPRGDPGTEEFTISYVTPRGVPVELRTNSRRYIILLNSASRRGYHSDTHEVIGGCVFKQFSDVGERFQNMIGELKRLRNGY
jgi:hypothetical protein